MENKANVSCPMRHIAFIMDGNRRWAAEKGLPQREGHRHGIRAVETTIRECLVSKIEYVSFFALSAENFSRPKAEIDYLLEFMHDYLWQIMRGEHGGDFFSKIKVIFVGGLKELPKNLQDVMNLVSSRELDCHNLTVIFAVNYSGRLDILQAADALSNIEKIAKTETGFSSKLLTFPLPDPDLIVRTGGTQRLSNFYLWQSSYSELLFIAKMWPSIVSADIHECFAEYYRRDRRFGL